MTLEKLFKKTFKDGCEFWTSEDGTLLSIAVCFSPDWPKILKERVESRNNKFKRSRVKIRYAYRHWADSDWFYFKGDRGKRS